MTGLVYDAENFAKTLRWLKAHNAIFQQRDDEFVTDFIWRKVQERIDAAGGQDKSTTLESGLGIFWHLGDAHHVGYPIDGPAYMINFFVRLGRDPALQLVDER